MMTLPSDQNRYTSTRRRSRENPSMPAKGSASHKVEKASGTPDGAVFRVTEKSSKRQAPGSCWKPNWRAVDESVASSPVKALRQAILNFPTRYARHILGLNDESRAKALLTKAAHEFLGELADFPEKIRDPDWLKVVEGEDGQEMASPFAHQAARRSRLSRRRPRSSARPRPQGCGHYAPSGRSLELLIYYQFVRFW